MKNNIKTTMAIILGLLFVNQSIFAAEVNVYSARKSALIKPLLDDFSKNTGITVNLITAKANALMVRLESEGKNSKADVFITTDAGRLHFAKQKDLLQKMDTSNIGIDKKFIDTDNMWVALSKRARVIFYNPKKINKSELSTYKALANSNLKGRVCIRGSNNIYNQSLVSSMLYNIGEKNTSNFLTNFVDNFARKPKGGDRDQIKGVANGVCDVAIANTYYYAGMLNDKKNLKQYKAAKKVALFWPNQKTTGTHINISGVAITKYAPNKNNAQKLIEFLLTKKAQKFYADVNFEMPVKGGVMPNKIIKNWGSFKEDDIKLSILGDNNNKAVKMMDMAGWR